MANELTARQREVLDFIREHVDRLGVPPTSREIQLHFGFASQTAAMDHLRALERKGCLKRLPGKARAVVVAGQSRHAAGSRRVEAAAHSRMIPVLGQIAAGMPVESDAEEGDVLALDAGLMGLPAQAKVFALRVRGDSMLGAHILDGDLVVLERRAPRDGEIVAALIDGETTLKRYVERNGMPFLKAENPRYPELQPASELTIQGVMVGLLRGAASHRPSPARKQTAHHGMQ